MIVNSDLKRALNGSKEFHKKEERMLIVSNIKSLDKVFPSVDRDWTVWESIKWVCEQLSPDFEIDFANGGHQNNTSIPEAPICEELWISLIDELGINIKSAPCLLNK